jgi:hypothetical protein
MKMKVLKNFKAKPRNLTYPPISIITIGDVKI